MLKKKCILPVKLRDELKKPLGFLLNEKELLDFLKKEKYIVSIGDQVTYTLLKNNIKPVFCIVDFKTMRRPCNNEIIKMIKSYGEKKFTVENPAGCISNDLWCVIKESYHQIGEETIRIEVDGEEDLAALPAIFLAPNTDVTIIYGMPDKGVVVVRANEENKNKAKKIIDEM
jgi:GTP-dependent dephospho-CoA kinase